VPKDLIGSTGPYQARPGRPLPAHSGRQVSIPAPHRISVPHRSQPERHPVPRQQLPPQPRYGTRPPSTVNPSSLGQGLANRPSPLSQSQPVQQMASGPVQPGNLRPTSQPETEIRNTGVTTEEADPSRPPWLPERTIAPPSPQQRPVSIASRLGPVVTEPRQRLSVADVHHSPGK